MEPERGKATDAIARVVDALLVVGDRYRILSEERRGYPELREQEEAVGAPLIALVERGQRNGELRDDLPAALAGGRARAASSTRRCARSAGRTSTAPQAGSARDADVPRVDARAAPGLRPPASATSRARRAAISSVASCSQPRRPASSSLRSR